jgi:hypothetical protein
MSDEIVTIRIPKQLKKRMKTSNLNWSRELRGAIEQRLAVNDRKKAASELDSLVASIKPGFNSTSAIKESRRHA